MIVTRCIGGTFTIALEPGDMFSKWHEFIDALKEYVPSSDRSYDVVDRQWTIAERYKAGVQTLADQFLIEIKDAV